MGDTERSIRTVGDALQAAEPRPELDATQVAKRQYAERLSKALGRCIADALRPRFPGIRPNRATGYVEASVLTSRGRKKSVDVGYVTEDAGPSLIVSIKTVTHPRYSHNFSGRDYELQAEALEIHARYPYAVIIGVHFMPVDAASDGRANRHSSFAWAVNRYRGRAGRDSPDGEDRRLERVFVGLYDEEGESLFWDVAADDPPEPTRFNPPPKNRPPTRDDGALTFSEFVQRIMALWDFRNDRRLVFRDETGVELLAEPEIEENQDE
jgi:hypothetical protein